LIGAAGLATPAHAAMYRWKDASGQVHYGDTLPASYQKSGATELSKQGIAVKHTPSEAERKLAAADAAEAARKKSLADEQARLDHALTATYTTVEEIDLARDRALEYHRLAINGAQIRAKVVDANLARWKVRAATISKAGRPIPPSLASQIAQAEAESLDLQRTVVQNQQAMIQVRDKYEADKQRFRALVADSH
jgi:hypothetical protein